MQNSNQPNQPTDKNKGDQSAVEQQQKETLKKPSPENMGGAQNAQQGDQADQQVTGQKSHMTNNDGAPVNASDANQAKGTMDDQQQKTMESNQGQGNKDKDKNMESNQQKNQWQEKDKNQANKTGKDDSRQER